ncbi:hypothetical protein BY458DRAFT_514697 [Sporodiniella umbellata]|nr:hypothetical protein BY458DRAFT_514635 [Sporodiniella umbellata]KAI9263047.1 hypothetical protein BY458DRAFT_514697 [Sporodiniella umbellata]
MFDTRQCKYSTLMHYRRYIKKTFGFIYSCLSFSVKTVKTFFQRKPIVFSEKRKGELRELC